MDGLERIEIEQREQARLRAADAYHSNKRSSAIGNTVIAILGIAILALLALLYIVIFLFSPGILAGMLVLGWFSPHWIVACVASLVLAAGVYFGIFWLAKSTEKTVMPYLGCCVVASGILWAISGPSHRPQDFLFGQFSWSGLSALAKQEPSTRTAPSTPTATFRSGELQPAAAPLKPPVSATPTSVASSSSDSSVPVQAGAASQVAASSAAMPQVPVPSDDTVQTAVVEPVHRMQESVTATVDAKPVEERAKPSFDCAKASYPVELRICANPELAILDRKLAEMYLTVRRVGVANSLERDQRAWIAVRNHCEDDNCLKGSYEMRLYQLTALSKP